MSKNVIVAYALAGFVAAPLLIGSSSAFAASVTLNGSGSTLSKAYQETAIEQFRKINKDLKINYGGGGSGKGRQDLADMVVDFAGSDAPYKEADLAKVKGGDV